MVKGAQYAIIRPRPRYEDMIALDRIPTWLQDEVH
jgi:diaminopimelate decarboxylase